MGVDPKQLPVDVTALLKEEFQDLFERGETKPMIGSPFPLGFYKDKPIDKVGRGVCNMLAWIRDNNNGVEPQVWMGFKASQSVVELRFVDVQTGEVIHTFGPHPVLGGPAPDEKFPLIHHLIGHAMAQRLGQKLQEVLKPTPALAADPNLVDLPLGDNKGE